MLAVDWQVKYHPSGLCSSAITAAIAVDKAAAETMPALLFSGDCVATEADAQRW